MKTNYYGNVLTRLQEINMSRYQVLQTMLEEDLLQVDLLSIRMDRQWVYLVVNGSILPDSKELIELLEEIARLTDKSIHKLKLKYNYWIY